MKRTLLDEGVPVGLVDLLGHHDVHHVHDFAWTGRSDAELIAAAVDAGFEVLVTTDQNMPYQQNLRAKPMALVVVRTTDWTEIRERAIEVRVAIADVKSGSHLECVVPRRRPRHRGPRGEG